MELDAPTRQINNIVLAAIPTPNYQGTLNDLKPLEAQRDMIVSHLGDEYNSHTREMVQTKDQVDAVNTANRYVKTVSEKNKRIAREIENKQQELDVSNTELQKQLARQKVVIDIFWVLGITIVVYMLFRSFSFVHILAAIVLVVGIVYVVVYNAYRLHLSSNTNPSATATVPSPIPNPSEWWNAVSQGTNSIRSFFSS